MFRMICRCAFPTLMLGAALATAPASAEEKSFDLTIENHRFEPETLNVPANARIKLLVRNADATPEEFESHELNVEKVIPGNTQATIYVGPLDPGSYAYVGEFHEETAKGSIVAK